MAKKLSYFVSVIGLIFFVSMMSCSAGSSTSETVSSTPSGGGSTVSDGATSGGSSDLSAIGLTPDPSWHDSYLVGSHSEMSCNDCHTSAARKAAKTRVTAREIPVNEICYQCHIDDYTATTLLNHAAANTGVYCNSCHYADSFTASVRPDVNQYHSALTGSCESCHASKTPLNHLKDDRASGCSACHKFPDWSAASFSGHSGITGGCAGCHTKHYAGFACEDCHTLGISWGFSHRAVTTQGCTGCHGAAGSDDDFDDEDDDDEYDDDRFDDHDDDRDDDKDDDRDRHDDDD